MFNKTKKKNKEENDNNYKNINIFTSLTKEKNKDKTEKKNQKINNFFKKLSNSSYLSNLESNIIIDFIKEIKNYFSEFMFCFEKDEEQLLNNELKLIFEKTSDKLEYFQPVNLLRNFTNNKCFFILNEYSNIDLYIYLYDLYELYNDEKVKNNKDKKNKSKMEIFNEIIININNLKETCSKNFISKKSSISIRKVSFIIHKYFLILNQYFNDNKSFFNEDNRIIILDKFTQTDCILDNNHIIIVLKNNSGHLNNKLINKTENNFMKFYSTFLYEYDLIKYIIDKKLLKFNKVDIIIKRKILQIKNGQIQFKKINLNNNIQFSNIKKNINESSRKKEQGEKSINIEELNYNENDYKNNKINNSKNFYNYDENYNLFKIKELFKYENSYPLIIFFLQNEAEISNLSFLLFTFYEIFLCNASKELTKEIIIKNINKFFYRFRSSKLTPIIFNKKYLLYFIKFFDIIINELKKSNNKNTVDTLLKQNEINQNKLIFENIILFQINSQNNYNDILKEITKDGVFNYLTKNISIFKIENEIHYNINQIGKMFKFNRILDTILELGKISIININEDNNQIIIYKLNVENFNNLLKKILKKVKFIGINKSNKTMNIHLFKSNDIVVKFKDEKSCININNDCLIY